MKKFLLGLLIGLLIMAAVPVLAEIPEYILYKSDCTLVVNGTDWQNSDLPMLNYKGYNYIPVAAFREISQSIGASFNFDNSTKQITLDTGTYTEPTPEPTQEPSQPATEPEANPTETTGGSTPTGTTQESTQETTTEPTAPETTKALQRVLTLEYDGSMCGCGNKGFVKNYRTVFENGQEYEMVDCFCINPKCPCYNTIIGGIRWRVEYQ